MRKPILLIGMMGCGKSTVGRLLAERMRLPLIDLDEEIAHAAGKTSPEIFAQEGEAGFRARETAAHLSFDNRMPPKEAAKALQKLLTE